VIAEAAAVAGLAKYINALGLPILPVKLRLLVETQTSLSYKTPPCLPRQGPQPGVNIIAFFLVKNSIYPLAKACRNTALKRE